MKVISMVPSWTETLLHCGIEVVGRTRFCIHPRDKVSAIPVVGGTKDIIWEKVAPLKADFIILDKEENPKSMADKSPIPFIATHVASASDMERECKVLGEKLNSSMLAEMSLRWQKILALKKDSVKLSEIPGVIEWINPLKPTIENFIYVIWKNPWMAVSHKTFIGSVMSTIGARSLQIDFDKPYPEFILEKFDPSKTALLCSTEPFPFARQKDFLAKLPFSVGLINGESYSWFGIRSLLFLESELKS